ncbi:coiled-coil domain-containing protein 86 [Conger conger]|uniref:coiled-coil domain-containing protein 86 n=1 Tax=Conger conger TaxID=82655 RepID=UPI002A5AC411|nr:coiled-coil domain-containing protein 86 [Conger conger]
MSKRRPRSDEGESVPPPKADKNPEHELSPPIVTRTRSGRRVRTPAALMDSKVPSSAKTPSRRARKSVIQEELNDNEESRSEGTESIKPTSVCIDYKSLSRGLDPETKKCKVDPINPSEVNQVRLHTDDNCQESMKSNRPAIQHEELLVSDISLQTHGSGQKENQVRMETQVGLGSMEKTNMKSGLLKSNVTATRTIPLGKPKSGRIWKDRNKHRFSALLRGKTLRSSWETKMEAKREKELVNKFSLQLKEEKAREKEEKRKRREETLKRREENERKAEVVQVIRNTTKIKRMKKKQLRKIEKRDTLALLQKSQPRNQNTARKGSKGSQ